MPQISITTNQQSPENAAQFREQLTDKLADWLNKPASFCMVHTQFDAGVSFAGSDEPTAMVEVASLGLQDDQPAKLTPIIGAYLHTELGIPEDRLYIRFSSPARSHWGWNGKPFG